MPQKLRQRDGTRTSSLRARLRAEQKSSSSSSRKVQQHCCNYFLLHLFLAATISFCFVHTLLPRLFATAAPQVAIIVTERSWGDGAVIEESRYEDERELQDVMEEEGEDAQLEWDMEEEEVSWVALPCT